MSATGDARDAGFTLLEALVVVALMTMISAFLFPNVSRAVATVQARQSASLVAAELRLARANALRTNRPVSVLVSEDGRRFGPVRADQTLPLGLRIDARPRYVQFQPDGSSSGGDLALGDFRITVQRATGAVSVTRP